MWYTFHFGGTFKRLQADSLEGACRKFFHYNNSMWIMSLHLYGKITVFDQSKGKTHVTLFVCRYINK